MDAEEEKRQWGDEELEMWRQSNDFVDVMFPSRLFFQLCWTVVV